MVIHLSIGSIIFIILIPIILSVGLIKKYRRFKEYGCYDRDIYKCYYCKYKTCKYHSDVPPVHLDRYIKN